MKYPFSLLFMALLLAAETQELYAKSDEHAEQCTQSRPGRLSPENVGTLVSECQENSKESDAMFSKMMQQYLDVLEEQEELELNYEE